MTLLLGQLLTSSASECTRHHWPAQAIRSVGRLIFRNVAIVWSFAHGAPSRTATGRQPGAGGTSGTPQPVAAASSIVTLVIFTS
jgi:hypothetical protein